MIKIKIKKMENKSLNSILLHSYVLALIFYFYSKLFMFFTIQKNNFLNKIKH